MDRGRVGEDRGSKETDGCPLTMSHVCTVRGVVIIVIGWVIECMSVIL
jgi:hypothetical protein